MSETIWYRGVPPVLRKRAGNPRGPMLRSRTGHGGKRPQKTAPGRGNVHRLLGRAGGAPLAPGTRSRCSVNRVSSRLRATGFNVVYCWQPAGRGLSSFADVECFWRERMEPYIDHLASMQLHPTRPDVPESSSWHANWRVRGAPGI